MELTIDELIDLLADARDDLGGDAPVRVAYQPSWPLRGVVSSFMSPNPTAAEDADPDRRAVWLGVGNAPHDENPYAPEWAFGGEE